MIAILRRLLDLREALLAIAQLDAPLRPKF